MKKKFLIIILTGVLLSACSLTQTLKSLWQQLRPQPTPAATSNSLLDLVENGQLSVVSARGDIGLGSLSGRTITLELYNLTDSPLEVFVPCGLALIPADENASRMMTVQSTTTLLASKDTAVIRPFVLGIDPVKALPTAEKTYRLEELEAGKLLQFSECLCKHDLPAETETRDLLSLQLAAWMVASDGVFTSLPESLNNLLQDVTGLPIVIPGLENTIQDLAASLAPNAQQWLDKCGISLGN